MKYVSVCLCDFLIVFPFVYFSLLTFPFRCFCFYSFSLVYIYCYGSLVYFAFWTIFMQTLLCITAGVKKLTLFQVMMFTCCIVYGDQFRCVSYHIHSAEFRIKKNVLYFLWRPSGLLHLLHERLWQSSEDSRTRSHWGYECIVAIETSARKGAAVPSISIFHLVFHYVHRDVVGGYTLLYISILNNRKVSVFDIILDHLNFLNELMTKCVSADNEITIIGDDCNFAFEPFRDSNNRVCHRRRRQTVNDLHGGLCGIVDFDYMLIIYWIIYVNDG